MITDLQLMKIKNSVMRILHVPGNYDGGILEMAIVADYHIPKEELSAMAAKLAHGLKRQNETFRNVRLNLIKWVSDEQIVKEISALPALQMGRAFADYEELTVMVGAEVGEVQETSAATSEGMENGEVCEATEKQTKTLDELLRQLKLFYARSKLIIVLTDGSYQIADEKKVWEHLNPFLRRKLLIVQPAEAPKMQFVSYVEISMENTQN